MFDTGTYGLCFGSSILKSCSAVVFQLLNLRVSEGQRDSLRFQVLF